MKTLIITIAVWAVLIGFLAGGVQVLATQPSPQSDAIQFMTTDNTSEAERMDPNRPAERSSGIAGTSGSNRADR